MKFVKCLAGLIILTLWAVEIHAAVAVQAAKTVDFTRYKTFAWKQGTPAANPAIEKMIRDTIQKQLLAKGLARVDTGADLLISTHAKQQSEMREDVDILGASERWTGDSEQDGLSGDTLRPIAVGTLVVDLLDGHSELNIWRATATRTLSDSPKTAQRQIEKAVKKMFESFPTGAD